MSSGQEWQFHIPIDIIVAKNGNFTLLLTSSGQEWQLGNLLLDLVADLPQVHHGIYIMGCIWQPFWILQERMGISSYLWIISIVNRQLALFSHVRCSPLDTPNTSKTPPKHPQMTITNFNYEVSYLTGLICNIVVRADLGRSDGRSIPPMHHGIYIMGCIWQLCWFLQERWEFCFFLNN